MNTSNLEHTPARPGIMQTVFRLMLGATLLFTGTSHLTWARTEFRAQVPRWLPLSADLVVVASGFIEIALGGALVALQRRRTTVGWIVAAFFGAIFPGNISQYVNHVDAFGLDTDWARALRLLFQPLLVLWSTGAWQVWRKSRRSQ
ncbi:MAG: hypothetical protein H0X37_24875 [Herpetosiphonaceae bacterium]|nr:hypothetical protein [Herpetosiphonaceae bacterium]